MMDFILEAWVSSNIERAKLGWMLGQGKPWHPGEKLKLLFAGYNGIGRVGITPRCLLAHSHMVCITGINSFRPGSVCSPPEEVRSSDQGG